MKKNETYENVAFGWVGILVCLVIASLCSCTDEFDEDTTIVNNVTQLTIKGDTNVTNVDLGGVTINPSDITINEGGTTVNEGDITVNVSPPNLTFNYAFTNNIVDSSKMFVHVDGSNLQTGDILISADNSNYLVSRDTTINNLNVTNTNSNDLSSGITVNADNSLYIESNVTQETCPYEAPKCIIRNCRFHHYDEYKKNHKNCK